MRASDVAVLLVLGAAVALLAVGRPPAAADPAAVEDLSRRIARLEEALSRERLARLESLLRELERSAAQAERSHRRVRDRGDAARPVEAHDGAARGAGGAREETRDGSPDGERDRRTLEVALERARLDVLRLRDRIEVSDAVAEELVRIHADHHLRVLTGLVSEEDDFPVLFSEMKPILDGEQLRVILTEFAPRRDGD